MAISLKHLKNEVNEAYQQIENALEVASEHQRVTIRTISTRSTKYGFRSKSNRIDKAGEALPYGSPAFCFSY